MGNNGVGGIIDFLGLSLPEALYLYLGIATQAMVRASSLRWVPRVIIVIWLGVLLWRAASRRGGWGAVFGYSMTCLVILILFWPETVPFGRAAVRSLRPSQVGSYSALGDGQAQVRTAEDTGQIPAPLQGPVLLPPGLRFLLRIATETPLALARTINSETHRTFASLQPMHWLLGTQLTSEVTTAIADWVHSCYLPVITTTMAGAQGRTIEELLPWGDASLLSQELRQRTVIPGAQTGITWLRGPTSDNSVPCDVYLNAVEFRTQAWLFDLKSPRGTPLLEVFQQELNLDAQQQSRFLLYREMLRAAGPAVPAPSLTGTYAAIRGIGLAGQAAGGGLGTGLMGWLSGAFAAGTTLLGAGRAAGTSLVNEFQRAIDGLSWLVGLAVFLTWWGPYLLGLINLVLLALFPFVVLWSLIPGSQFQPLAHYVSALLFTNSAPLWWALADQAAKLAQASAPQSDDLILGMGNAAVAFGWSTIIMVLAVLVIPVVTGIIFFGVFRALGSLWRGAV